MAHHLVPISKFISGFTTNAELTTKFPQLIQVPLADKPLQVHKSASRTPHPLVEPPPPACPPPLSPSSQAWEATYPKGSVNPSAPIPGGFGFYLKGPEKFSLALGSATEAVFSYRMMLQDEWAWVKGGKLPGTAGLVTWPMAVLEDGKNTVVSASTYDRCGDSVGELYTYLPLTECNATQLGSVPPLSIQNHDYGFSVGRGSFKLGFSVGNWISIAFRIKLNDVGHENGAIQLWVDGASVISIGGLSLRESEESKIKGMHFQTFFGGHGEEWASPKDQHAWFADVTAVIIS